ncbi:hypothetical protein, partial [Pseudomonas viridiflava]|uniref:hypothetical protein n=2 Tax=Pseudomonas viridiflava TaxID=33069 RepID=UPI003BB09773
LEQLEIVGKVVGHGFHALDYTESGHESRRQNLMGTVTPEVKTIEQPVQLLNGQDNRLVGGIGRCFESLRFQAFEPKAEAVALPVHDFHSVARLVEENEKYRVEHGNLDIQFDQRSQAVDGFSKVHRFGVEVNFFDFGVGSHHGARAPESIGSPASGISLVL